MKKGIKIFLIVFCIVIGILFLDSIQALVFDNSPIIKVRKYYNGGDLYCKDSGLLIDTYYGTNGKKDAVIKGFSYSLSDDTNDEAIKNPSKKPADDSFVLRTPPALNVLCGKQFVTALRGTTSWTYTNADGTQTGINSDSMHPLNAKEHMTPLNLIPTTVSSIDPLAASLQWTAAPDKVTVRYWSEKSWGQATAKSKDIPVNKSENGYAIRLEDGNYIYEVIAEWTGSEKFGGTASYSFYTLKPDMQFKPIGE